MSKQTCRWGIMSAATIAAKNWKAIRLAENADLIAVASRDAAKAQQFIDNCQGHTPFANRPQALGNYESLLTNDDIDAVYVPLPTAVRKEWVIRAADAGKHVLCEKPCAISLADLQEMIDACQRNNVQFMDGVMFMHSARLAKVREAIHDGVSEGGGIGKLRRIATQFSFLAPDDFLNDNIRASASTEPAGCVGDLGWYTIRFTLFANDYRLPKAVRGTMLNGHGGDQSVPMEFSGELFFDNDVSASFYCSFLTENQQWASISGSGGSLLVKDFVLPFHGSRLGFETLSPQFEVSGCDFVMKGSEQEVFVDEYSNSAANAQETNMIRTFSANVLAGKSDPFWPEVALKTQRVMDACLDSATQGGALIEV